LARGAWRVARGAWRVARGAWRVARGAWRVARGAWRVVCQTAEEQRSVQSMAFLGSVPLEREQGGMPATGGGGADCSAVCLALQIPVPTEVPPQGDRGFLPSAGVVVLSRPRSFLARPEEVGRGTREAEGLAHQGSLVREVVQHGIEQGTARCPRAKGSGAPGEAS